MKPTKLFVPRPIVVGIIFGIIIGFYVDHFDLLKSKPVAPILAFSFDYQDCLANANYQKQYIQWMELTNQHKDIAALNIPWKNALLSYDNLKLASFLIHTVKRNCAAVVFFNGSNRQFLIHSAKKPGSIEYFKDAPLPVALDASEAFFHYMTALLNINQVPLKMDSFLLGDIYEHHVHGYTWKNANQMKPADQSLSRLVKKRQMDRDKFDIIYSQVHKLATQYHKTNIIGKKQNIQFYFFDDKLEILEALIKFFNDNPDLLPANTSLFLMHYTGEILNQLGHIKGQGLIDTYYPHSVYYTYDYFKDEIRGDKLHKIQLLSKEENLTAFKAYRLDLHNGSS